MRILLVNDLTEKFGGAEEHIYGLRRLLTEHGHIVNIIGESNFNRGIFSITRFYNPLMFVKTARKIAEFKPDIIHCHGVSRNISPAPLHAAKRYGVPVIMTVHDFHLVCSKTWFVDSKGLPCQYGFGRRCIYKNCQTFKMGFRYLPYQWLKILKVFIHRSIISKNVDVFISPSAILADWLRKSMHVKRVEVLPNFVQIDEISPSKLKETKTILYVGRLSKEKGIEYLIRAMPLVIARAPQARLVIVGSGLERVNLEKLVTELNIGEAVSFSGHIKHDGLTKYYNDAEVVVIPSVWAENCPLTALEAMAHGIPLVASNIFGIPEIVQDGKTGFLFEFGKPDDIADKIIRILTDFELAKCMSEKARQVTEQLYSPDNYYQRLIKIYSEAKT